MVRLHEAAVGARSAFVTAEAIEREVVGHRLEWLRVDASTMELETDDMAREAMLSIRADGRSLADVAADCGVQPAALSVLVGEVEGEMSSRLLAAREGDVLGPIPRDGAFTVLLIERKTPPDAADPAVRRRAEERLIGRAVEQAINRCVTWHESF